MVIFNSYFDITRGYISLPKVHYQRVYFTTQREKWGVVHIRKIGRDSVFLMTHGYETMY
jgi:hypothetical protein